MYMPLMSFFGGEFTTATLTRYLTGSYVNGDWVPGTNTTSTISVTYPQAVKPNEIQSGEQGERISDFVKIYTDAVVNPRTDSVDADRLTILGVAYKVWSTDNRPIGEYRRVILRRL